MTIILGIINLSSLIIVFNDGSKQEDSSLTSFVDLFDSDDLNFKELDFHISINVKNPIPAEIGHIVASQIDWTDENYGRRLDQGKCSDEFLKESDAYWIKRVGFHYLD